MAKGREEERVAFGIELAKQFDWLMMAIVE